jgi:hypothetical protein
MRQEHRKKEKLMLKEKPLNLQRNKRKHKKTWLLLKQELVISLIRLNIMIQFS